MYKPEIRTINLEKDTAFKTIHPINRRSCTFNLYLPKFLFFCLLQYLHKLLIERTRKTWLLCLPSGEMIFPFHPDQILCQSPAWITSIHSHHRPFTCFSHIFSFFLLAASACNLLFVYCLYSRTQCLHVRICNWYKPLWSINFLLRNLLDVFAQYLYMMMRLLCHNRMSIIGVLFKDVFSQMNNEKWIRSIKKCWTKTDLADRLRIFLTCYIQ